MSASIAIDISPLLPYAHLLYPGSESEQVAPAATPVEAGGGRFKAFCYRSGHVGIGRTVPPGAAELADHDNQEQLCWVVAYHTRQFADAEGCPQTVIPGILLAKNDFSAELSFGEVADAFEDDLARIKQDPTYMTALVPGPIIPWKDEASAQSGVGV